MKAYLCQKEISYNAIFYSAYKALLVFELILDSPKTLEQLQDIICEKTFIKKKISKDTLRLYINTFEKAGCKVIRQLTKEKHREYSYFIPQNPFYPQIKDIQVKRFFEVYDMLFYNLPFTQVIELEKFVKKLLTKFENPKFEIFYQKHSLLHKLNFDLLIELENHCSNNDLITILYQSPRSGEKEMKVIAQNIKIQNYKVYLQGYGLDYEQDGIFLVERILGITDYIPGDKVSHKTENPLKIIYELYDSSVPLLENEKLLENTDDKRIIEHSTTNKVLSNQRFLELSDNCKILEPKAYKEEFIHILQSMKEEYLHGKKQ